MPNHVCVSPSGKARELYEKIQKEYPEASKRDNLNLTKVCQWIGLYNTYKNKDIDYVPSAKTLVNYIERLRNTSGKSFLNTSDVQFAVEGNPASSFNISTAEFYSGAAKGADKEWGAVARDAGIKVTDYTPEDWDALSAAEKNRFNAQYNAVVNLLHRRPLDEDTLRGKLVRRDMMQVDKADSVLAVGVIVKPKERGEKYVNTSAYEVVDGGTGYAVAQGIRKGIPVYVFDQGKNTWNVWDKDSNSFKPTAEPRLTQHAAVVGTENINYSGRQAIKSVVSHTINPPIQQFSQPKPSVLSTEARKSLVDQFIVSLKSRGIKVGNAAEMERFLKRDPKAAPEIQEAIEQEHEMQAIKEKAIANGTFMKAPNGKPTNLNERQWLQVRTKAFKKWFGDWINDPANASKVVDENGEPLVVYRGDSNGKTQFNPTKPSYNVQGIYIAGNKTFASNYTKPSFYNNYTEGILYEVFVNAKNPIYNSRDIEGWNSGKYDTNDSWIYGNFPNGNGELVVRNSNQIKSATDNIGTFSTENGDIQMMVVGENGARSLDATEEVTTRMDNLAVANDMEKAGKDALTIKVATGWERGADGKWRYEIPDVKLKKDSFGEYEIRNIVGNGKNLYVTRDLSEVVDLSTLPATYREELEYVGEIRIYDDFTEAERGSYITRDGKVVFTLNLGADESPKSILAHEFQHYIQDREGFQPGGNTSESIDALLRQRGIYEVYQQLLNDQNGYSQTLMKILSKDKKYNEYEGIARRLDQALDMVDLESTPEEDVTEFIKQWIPNWKEGVNYDQLAEQRKDELIKEHREELEQAEKHSEENYKKLQAIQKTLPSSYDAYQRLAGEVEARAAGRRVTLSVEERRNSLFTDEMYKDVAREDLIFLEGILNEAQNSEQTNNNLQTFTTTQEKQSELLSGTTSGQELKELSKEELSKDIKEYFESEEGTASLPEGVSDEEPPIDIEAEEEYIKRKEQEEKRRKLLEERAKKESSDPRVREKFAGYHCQRAYYLLKRLKDMGSPYSDLIDILLPKLGSLGYIRIYLDEEGDLIRNGAVGMYYSDKNYITVSGRGTMPGKDGLIDGTVIHEILHAFTMNSLRFRDNYNKLTDIYKEAKEKIFKKYNVNSLYEIKDPAVVRNLYGLTDPAEFISEFFTNAAFIKELNDENIFGEKDSKESVIHKILDWIKSLFGGTTDIYQRADEVIEDLVLNYGGHIIPSLYRVKRARMLKGEGKKPLADTPQAFEMTTPEGTKTVYGFYNHPEKKIYLDENIVDLDHGVHEFTHLWDRVLQETQPKLWKKGVELMQSEHLGLWNQIQRDPNYGGKWIKEGKSIEELTNLIASEVHSRIVGKKGKEFIEQKALEAGEVGKNFFEKLKNWILEAWKSIKATFSDWTDDEIAALSIDDFDNMTLRDLFSGINPFDAAKRYTESRSKKQQPAEQQAQNPYKVEIYAGHWTREEVEKQSDKVFLFGDNTDDRVNTHHVPTSTQAVIRGLPNAIGIDTKKNRGVSADSYFTDADFDTFKTQVDYAIKKAKSSGKTIVIPEDGIGTGKAMLEKKAPRLFDYLQKELKKLQSQSSKDEKAGVGNNTDEVENTLSSSPSQAAIAEQQNEPQPPSPEQQKMMEQFKKDIELLAGYYEGGGRVIQDDFSGITKELDDKLDNHFMAGKELDIDTLRELWKVIEFGHGANNKVTYYKDKVTGNIYVDESGIADKTEAWGVEINPNLKNEYAEWQKKNPTGLIAYRVNSNKYNTPSEVYSGRIGNPFSEEEHGASTVFRFFDWLVNGNNYNNKKATEEYRQAIIEKILRTPNGAPILYYEELKRPSHATVLGYLVNNKQLLPQSKTSERHSSKATKLDFGDNYVAPEWGGSESQSKSTNTNSSKRIAKPNSVSFESALVVKQDRKSQYRRTFSPRQLKDRGRLLSNHFSDILDEWVGEEIDICEDIIQDSNRTEEEKEEARVRLRTIKDPVFGRQQVFEEHTLQGMLEKIYSTIQNNLELCSNQTRKVLYQNTLDFLPDLFFEQAVLEIGEREGIHITGYTINKNNISEQNNDANPDDTSGDVAVGNEGWGYSMKFSNPIDSLTRVVKSMLYTIERPEGEVDDLGYRHYYPMGQCFVTLMQYISKNVESADDFLQINKNYEDKSKLGYSTEIKNGEPVYEGVDVYGNEINEDTYPEGYPTFPVLEKMALWYPWVRQVIQRLTDDYYKYNDDIHFPYTGGSMASQLYSATKKPFMPYGKIILDDEGKYDGKITPLNYDIASKMQKDKLISNYNNRILLTDTSVYDASGRINKDNVEEAQALLVKVSDALDTYIFSEFPTLIESFNKDPKSVEEFFGQEDLDNFNEAIDNLSKALRSFGIDINKEFAQSLLCEEEDEYRNSTIRNIIGKLNQICDILKEVKDEDLDTFDYILDTQTKYGTNLWAHFFDEIGLITDDTYVQSFYDTASKKTRYSYTAENFLMKQFRGICMGSLEKRRAFIDKTFGEYEWFRDQKFPKGTGWRNRWLEYWYNKPGDIKDLPYLSVNNITDTTGTTTTVRDYERWLPSDIFELQYRAFDNDPTHGYDNSLYCNYLAPIFSDSPMSMCVRGPKMSAADALYGGTVDGKYKRGALVDLVHQELWRMKHVQDRAKEIAAGNLEEIACFDKRGKEFCFIPELNDYTTSDGKKFIDRIYEINKGIEKGENSVRDLDNFIVQALENVLLNPFLDYYAESGVGSIRERTEALVNSGLSPFSSEEGGRYLSMLYAQASIIQLTCGDLAFSKNNVDFAKRFKQVYSGGLELNTNSKYGKKNETSILLCDILATSPIYKQICEIVDSNEYLLKNERDRIKEIFRNINIADAQAFRAMHSVRSVLDMLGRWDSNMEETLKRIESGKWSAQDFDVLWQTIKPFAYALNRILSANGVNLAVPQQHKNSEICALMMYPVIVNSLKNSPVYTALSEFMDETRGADGKPLFDMAQFESAGKMGNYHPIDISHVPSKVIELFENGALDGRINFIPVTKKGTAVKLDKKFSTTLVKILKEQLDEKLDKDPKKDDDAITQEEYNSIIASIRPTKEEIKSILKDQATMIAEDGSIMANPKTTHTMPFDRYYQQQPTPAHHIDSEAVLGSQAKNLIIADLPEDFKLTLSGKKVKGKNTTKTFENRDSLIDFFMEVLNENLIEDYFGKNNKKGLKGIFADKKALKEALEDLVKGNPKYGRDFADALEIDEKTGNFVLNPNSPTMFYAMQELVTSLFKNRITKQTINGAALIQAAGIGLSDQLHLKYENGKIVGAECYMPLTSKALFEPFLIKRKINGELVDVLDEKALERAGIHEAIGYRIPTENKSSMLPLIIKGFTPIQNGSVVILPMEITALAGSDFDVDKLYTMLLSFSVHKYNMGKARRAFAREQEKVNPKIKAIFAELFKSGLLDEDIEDNNDDLTDEEIKEEFEKWFAEHKEDYLHRDKKTGEPRPLVRKIEYDFGKTPKENGRKARNNMLIQIMFGILTSKEGNKALVNPQGFPNLEDAAKLNALTEDEDLLKKFIKDKIIDKQGLMPPAKDIKKIFLDAMENTMEDSEFYTLSQQVYSMSDSEVQRMYANTILKEQISWDNIVKTILEMNSNELNAFVNNNKKFESPVYPQSFIHTHARMMAGAKQIGIYAIQSSNAAKYQRSDIILLPSQRFTVNGRTVVSISDSDNGRKVKSCGEMVGGSADNGKNPNLTDAGSTDKTATIFGYLLRCGLTHKEASLIVSCPLMEQAGYNYRSPIFEEILGKNPLKGAKPEVTTEMLLKMKFRVLSAEEMKPVAALIMRVLWQHESIEYLNNISRCDSPKGGMANTYAKVRIQRYKVDLYQAKAGQSSFPFLAIKEALSNTAVDPSAPEEVVREQIKNQRMAHLHAMYALGINSFNSLVGDYFFGAQEWFDKNIVTPILYNINEKYPDKTKEQVVDNIYKSYIAYRLSASPLFGDEYDNDGNLVESMAQKREWYLTEYPKEFIKALSDNEELRSLLGNILTTEDGVIKLKDVGSRGKEQRLEIQLRFDSLLYSDNPEVRDTAKHLLLYSYYKDGLFFSPNSYSTMFTTRFLTSFPEYANTLDDLNEEVDVDDYTNFIDQFLVTYNNNVCTDISTIVEKAGDLCIYEEDSISFLLGPSSMGIVRALMNSATTTKERLEGVVPYKYVRVGRKVYKFDEEAYKIDKSIYKYNLITDYYSETPFTAPFFNCNKNTFMIQDDMGKIRREEVSPNTNTDKTGKEEVLSSTEENIKEDPVVGERPAAEVKPSLEEASEEEEEEFEFEFDDTDFYIESRQLSDSEKYESEGKTELEKEFC